MENKKMTVVDYPLISKRKRGTKTPTGKALEDITLEKVLSGEINADDIGISSETLEMQAQIVESMNRDVIARNFRRATELIRVPDDRILEMYNALRPYRSTKEGLFKIADELETKYDAKINADFVRGATEVCETRSKLRIEK